MDPSHSKQFSMDNEAHTSDLTPISFTSYKVQPTKLYRAFFDDPTSSDVTICLGNRRVYAHRIALCRGSKYFASMLAGRFQVSQMPAAPPDWVSQTNFEQQESASKEIELKEDDSGAMLALLRFLYDLPYNAEANSKWVSSLQPHASVYVVADKYQLDSLKEAVANNMQKILTSKTYTNNLGHLRWCDSFKNAGDFFGTLNTILEVTTTQDTQAREVLICFIIHNINFFRKQDKLLSLFKDYPELAVQLISDPDLEVEAEGTWMCVEDSCVSSVPGCTKCNLVFEPQFLRRHRYDEQWQCLVCKVVDQASCVECKSKISWVPESDGDSTDNESDNEERDSMDLDDGAAAAAKVNRWNAGR